MIQNQLYKGFISLFIACFILTTITAPINADSSAAFESPLETEKARKRIEEVMQRIDFQGYEFKDETLGFSFLLSNRFLSPFNYDIYAGPISSKIPVTIIRLEGDTGDVLTLTRIFEIEKIIKIPPRNSYEQKPLALTDKYHIFSQGLNIVAPWLAVLHSSYKSPRLSKGQTLFRFLTYLFLDIFIVYGTGTNLFRQKFSLRDPRKCTFELPPLGAFCTRTHEIRNTVTAGLVLVRLLGMFQHLNLIRGHNRIAELKYSFYFD